MPWQVSTEPDSLPFSQQVTSWMERCWRSDNACTVCGQNDWRAEGRVFRLQRMVPAQDPQGRQSLTALEAVGRAVFPIMCMHCGHTVLVEARTAGVLDSPIPGDLSGLQ